jgi:chromosome segregation ATPase
MLTLSKLVEKTLVNFGYPKEEIDKIKKSISAVASRKELPFEVVKTEEGLHAVPETEENISLFAYWIADKYYPCERKQEKTDRIVVSSELEKVLFQKYEGRIEEIIKLSSSLAELRKKNEMLEEKAGKLEWELEQKKKELMLKDKKIEELEESLNQCRETLRRRKVKEGRGKT